MRQLVINKDWAIITYPSPQDCYYLWHTTCTDPQVSIFFPGMCQPNDNGKYCIYCLVVEVPKEVMFLYNLINL